MNGEEFNVLWDFLLVCESHNLIKFNYSLEVLKTKVQHCIHEHKLAHPSLDWHLISNPHSQTTNASGDEHTGSEEIFDNPSSHSHVTPPLLSSIEDLLETPSCLPLPPLTTSVRYRIVGEIPLPKDRRKTNFNFNISLSDSMFDDSISHENVSCDVSCEEKDVFSDKGDLLCGKLEQVLFDDDKINEDEDYQEVGGDDQEVEEDDEEDDQEVVENDQEVEEDDQEDDQEVEEDDQEVEEDDHEVEEDDQEVVENDQEEDDQEVEEDDQEVEEDDQEEDEDDQEVEEDDQEEDEEKGYKDKLLKKNRKEEMLREMNESGLQIYSEIQDDKQHVEENDCDRKQEIMEENMTNHYKTPPSTINLISDDSDDDDKLENLFSNLRLQSAKKEAMANKTVSRKSLNEFIVSDSEEISEDEENNENKPPHTLFYAESPVTPNYHRKHLKSPNVSPGVCSTPVYQHKSHTLVQNSLTTPSASKSVRRYRNQMIEELFQLFNKTVFNNKFPADMEIKWNKRLRTTAGYCAYKGSISCRTASIEISTKVCDSYDRIRDTLIHELCHAATWVIDGIRKAGHGRAWKCWAKRAHDIYPDLSPITRCHHYEISYKYTYNCTRCDFKIGRHSKSVNLQTARCPYCMSCLELL